MKQLAVILLAIGLFSCNSNEDIRENKEAKIQDSVIEYFKDDIFQFSLAGNIYTYAPKLDSTCQAYGECDCCSGNYLFINETDFIIIDYCEADYIYSKGTYELKGDKVFLHYSGIVIGKNYNWEKETDTTNTVKPDYFINENTTEPTTRILTRIACANNICFNTGMEEMPYAALDKKQKLEDLVSQLRSDGIWKKLRMDKNSHE
ncbi:MAG: hypothetical protein KF900_03920 [Bacteroidetes bacterium]|nr:hypothetical protein [Bacteroidota bacterium]